MSFKVFFSYYYNLEHYIGPGRPPFFIYKYKGIFKYFSVVKIKGSHNVDQQWW